MFKNSSRKKFYFNIDQEFIDYFQNRLKQVFLYMTNECQLRCRHCLYKPNLVFSMKQKEISFKTIVKLMSDFRTLGAVKFTFIGGEPSCYGDKRHKQLMALIEKTKELGYRYVRLDTNGQFEESFLDNRALRKLDEISFSLDGPNSKIHDYLRGKDAFGKCIANIKKAITLGHPVYVTTCIHRKLIKKDRKGTIPLFELIRFLESIGVKTLNLHALFKHGFFFDTWTGETDIKVKEWIKISKELNNKIRQGKYKISIRVPQHFVTVEEFRRNPKYYGYCTVKLGERVLVQPNGEIRICAGTLGSPYHVATFYKNKISWEKSGVNETLDHKLNEFTPCTNQSKGMEYEGYLPLCFSFKPLQNEFVWNNELRWESRRTPYR